MEKPLRQSLEEIKTRFMALNEALQAPALLSDIKSYTKLTREINAVEEIVLTYEQFLKQEQAMREARKLLEETRDEDMASLAKTELESAQIATQELEAKLKILLLPQDPNDDKNVIIEIRGAAGGDEANIFAGDLFDIYKKWCAQNHMQVQLLDAQRGEAGGYTQVVFRVIGEKVYAKLKFESGVHRVQRVPTTEAQGRVHTSTATVTVMPEADETVEIDIKPADIKIDTFRSSGAGGQSVNTTDSAVRITHLPTGIVISSQDGRSQIANRETAMQLLRTRLYDLEVQKQQAESAVFRLLAGSGARAEKIRTYNYPQDRVTDHRIGFSTSLKSVAMGKLDVLIDALVAAEQVAKMREVGLNAH